MPVQPVLLDNLVVDLKKSINLVQQCTSIWVYRARTIVLDFETNSLKFALDLNYSQGEFTGSVLARSDSGARLLRDALIGKFEMVISNGERHVFGSLKDAEEFPEIAADQCRKWILYTKKMIDLQISPERFAGGADDSCINVAWWDKKPNFGDVIGPWIVAKVTGKDVVNGLGRKLSTPPLMTVGSIMNLLDQDHSVVWGTGLMNPLNEASVAQLQSVQGVSVRSVRGKLTRNELVSKLGWDVPEVYGDPALLLPRFIPKPDKVQDTNPIVIVPHYMHMEYFQDLKSSSSKVLDVKDGMERIVRSIASARVCISTSLHGIIIAQAYGIPWVWLRVSDHRLGGGTFKFQDFFTTLDASAVSSADVAAMGIATLDVEAMAKTASLPELQISLQDLMESFPAEARRKAVSMAQVHKTLVEKRTEGRDVPEDVEAQIDALMRKMDSIAGELAEQRRLLEQLVSAQ